MKKSISKYQQIIYRASSVYITYKYAISKFSKKCYNIMRVKVQKFFINSKAKFITLTI